jgi:transposase
MHSSRRRRAGDIEWVNADARVTAGAEKCWTCSCRCGGRCMGKAEERACRLWLTMRQIILVGAM